MAAAEIGSQKKTTDLHDGVVSKVKDEFELPSLFYCRLYKFASTAVACNVCITKHKRPPDLQWPEATD